jgi:hypothetical protein
VDEGKFLLFFGTAESLFLTGSRCEATKESFGEEANIPRFLACILRYSLFS